MLDVAIGFPYLFRSFLGKEGNKEADNVLILIVPAIWAVIKVMSINPHFSGGGEAGNCTRTHEMH